MIKSNGLYNMVKGLDRNGTSIAESQTTDLVQQDTVYKRLSQATVNEILKGMGLKYKEIRATDGRYIYQFELRGFGVGLTLQETGEILELFSGFPMNPPLRSKLLTIGTRPGDLMPLILMTKEEWSFDLHLT